MRLNGSALIANPAALAVIAAALAMAWPAATRGADEPLGAQLAAEAAPAGDARAAGIEAVKAERYREGLAALMKWNDERPGDADVLCHMAIARRHLPLRRHLHIAHAIGWLEAALRADPDHEASQRELLDLYRLAGQYDLGRALADRVLARSPGDFGALKTRAAASFHARDFNAALADSLKAIDARDEDVQVVTLALLSYYRLDRADAAMALARRLHEAAPNDVRYQLTLAIAHVLVNQRDEAVGMLKRAAAQDMPDAPFTAMLVTQMDTAGLYDDATALLEREAPRLPPRDRVDLTMKLLHRHYQQNRPQDVVDRVADTEPEADDDTLDRLGLKAMSLMALKREADAAPLIDALARFDDPVARVWATLLNDTRGGLGGAGLARLRLAANGAPFNPYLRDRVGWRMLEAGEPLLAIEQFEAAARMAPAWPEPHTLMSEAYLRTNRPDKAAAAAQEALRRGPQNAAAVVVFVRAMHRLAIDGDKTDAADQLLAMLDKMHAHSPDEPNTLAIYVDLLAWRGRTDEATAILRRAAEAKPPKPIALRRALQQVSDRRKLGVDLRADAPPPTESPDDTDHPDDIPKEPAP